MKSFVAAAALATAASATLAEDCAAANDLGLGLCDLMEGSVKTDCISAMAEANDSCLGMNATTMAATTVAALAAATVILM